MNTQEALVRLNTYLEQNNLKSTSQRRLITQIFFDERYRESHPSVEELYLRVRERDKRVGYATVYRTLKLLVDSGLATPSRLGDNQTRYEPEIPGEHHDHLVCSECGTIFEFENPEIEQLQEAIAKKYGFELTNHHMVLYGRPSKDCADPPCGCGK